MFVRSSSLSDPSKGSALMKRMAAALFGGENRRAARRPCSRSMYRSEDAADLCEREVRVKDVRHAVDEHAPRVAPAKRNIEAFLPEPRCERVRAIPRRVLHGQMLQVGLTRLGL